MTLPKSVGFRAQEGQRSPNARSVEKDFMDSVGHEATHHHTKNSPINTKKKGYKEDGKGTQKAGKSKGGKDGTEGKGKGKGKNVSTKSQNLQKKVRACGKMTCTQQSRLLTHQQQMKNFNMLPSVNCDFRILVLTSHQKLFSLTDWTHSPRTVTFGIDTAACKTVVPANHTAAREYLIHKDSSL